MNNRGRPASSAPCNLLGSMTRPTCTPGDSPLIRAPSAWVTDTVAMVIVGSLPPSPGGGLAVVLLAMITALAPAACAFAALSTKDRKSVGSGKSVSVRVYLGGRRIIKKNNHNKRSQTKK